MALSNIMIDLETLGTRFDAPILAVGAVYFDPRTGQIGKPFYGSIRFEDAFANGKPSGDTVKWWMKQDDAARAAVTAGKHPADFVLTKFKEFVRACPEEPVVWGNGPTFDITILAYGFGRVLREPVPWQFWNVRDCRTIKDIAFDLVDPNIFKPIATAHNALEDAKHQAKWVSVCWQKLRPAA